MTLKSWRKKLVNSNDQYDSTIFEGLTRKFTVQAAEKTQATLLQLGKDALLKMKIEFHEEFREFFEQAYPNLEKIIDFRIACMESCAATARATRGQIPNYDIKVLTNVKIDLMTPQEMIDHIKKELE